VNNQSENKKAHLIENILMLSMIALIYVALFPFLLPHIIKDIALRFKFRKAAISQGKFILFVYSDSPHWKSYIERNILPQIQDHAVILNWSERNQWDTTSWPVRVFKHWGGRKDFNPLAVVFCSLTQVRVIRFYPAFLDFKHGKEALLRQAESQLLDLANLETTPRIPHNGT
jgi:hypothetical protein